MGWVAPWPISLGVVASKIATTLSCVELSTFLCLFRVSDIDIQCRMWYGIFMGESRPFSCLALSGALTRCKRHTPPATPIA